MGWCEAALGPQLATGAMTGSHDTSPPADTQSRSPEGAISTGTGKGPDQTKCPGDNQTWLLGPTQPSRAQPRHSAVPGRRFRGQRLSLAGRGWLDRAPPARSCRLGSGRPPEGDSLEQLGLEQTLQTVADHGLPEQGLLPVLPWGQMRPQLTPAPPRDARPLIRPPSAPARRWLWLPR